MTSLRNVFSNTYEISCSFFVERNKQRARPAASLDGFVAWSSDIMFSSRLVEVATDCVFAHTLLDFSPKKPASSDRSRFLCMRSHSITNAPFHPCCGPRPKVFIARIWRDRSSTGPFAGSCREIIRSIFLIVSGSTLTPCLTSSFKTARTFLEYSKRSADRSPVCRFAVILSPTLENLSIPSISTIPPCK